jgi:hypothetical protein
VALGIITSHKIGKNRDGDADRVLLQVKMLDEDVRTVELFPGAGVDSNPANGCRVEVVEANGVKISGIVSDDIAPESDPGEYEIYSTDNPAVAKKASVKLSSNGDITITAFTGAKIEIKADGDIILNSGTGSAVKFSELETAFNQLKDDFDDFKANHKHGGVTIGAGTTAVSDMPAPSTADISAAEVPEVKL